MPEPARISVCLRIIGDTLDPDEVTRLLGVEPTAGVRKGDLHRTGSGREIPVRTGIWRLQADATAPDHLDARIAALLACVPSDPAVWQELSRRFRCDVFCGLFVYGGNAGVGLRPQVLAMLGERGLQLDLDIYACSE